MLILQCSVSCQPQTAVGNVFRVSSCNRPRQRADKLHLRHSRRDIAVPVFLCLCCRGRIKRSKNRYHPRGKRLHAKKHTAEKDAAFTIAVLTKIYCRLPLYSSRCNLHASVGKSPFLLATLSPFPHPSIVKHHSHMRHSMGREHMSFSSL